MKYIQTVIDQNLIKSSYEEFAQNVMHPLSFDELPKLKAVPRPMASTVELRATPRPMASTVELRATPRPVEMRATPRPIEMRVAVPRPIPSDGSPAPSQTDSKRSSVTKIGSLFSARRNGSSKVLSDRPESEAHRSTAGVCEPIPPRPPEPPTLQRNHSVPENLSEMESLVQSHHVRSPSSSSHSNLHKNMS